MLDKETIEQVSIELLIALRGRRSQSGWSQRLGYRSNVVHRWESGKRWPKATEVLRACSISGIDVTTSLEWFFNRRPEWLDAVDPITPAAVGHILEALRGDTTIQHLAERSGYSRFAVSRWLKGETQPRLPEFLMLIEAASMRVLDLLASLVDPSVLPSIQDRWSQLEARRWGANQLPWTQALIRALELETYQKLPAHRPGWLAKQLGITVEQEVRCLSFLEETGQISWVGTHYQQDNLTVDTSRYPEIGRRLKVHWAQSAIDRIQRAAPGQFSYNVFSVSREDFERIREAHLRYFHALRAIVSDSQPSEIVAVANIHLFALNPADGKNECPNRLSPPRGEAEDDT